MGLGWLSGTESSACDNRLAAVIRAAEGEVAWAVGNKKANADVAAAFFFATSVCSVFSAAFTACSSVQCTSVGSIWNTHTQELKFLLWSIR